MKICYQAVPASKRTWFYRQLSQLGMCIALGTFVIPVTWAQATLEDSVNQALKTQTLNKQKITENTVLHDHLYPVGWSSNGSAFAY